MGSGAQAQLAAQQAASAEQLKAFEEALAFQKDIFAKSQAQRKPYIDAGTSSLAMLMGLLGLQTQASGGPGAPFKPTGSPAGSLGSRPSAPGGTRPGGPAPTSPAGIQPTTLPPNDYSLPGQPINDSQIPPFTSLTSGSQDYQAPLASSQVTVTAPDGSMQQVPAALVPFYRSKGWSV